MDDLAGEELEKAVQLVGIASQGRCECDWICLRRRFERSHVHLQPVSEPLDASEHTDRVSLVEPRVEQLDVVPHARLDPPARIDELEGEIRRSATRAQPPLACNRVDALDDAFLGELCDCAHAPSLGPGTDARFRTKWRRSGRSGRCGTTRGPSEW